LGRVLVAADRIVQNTVGSWEPIFKGLVFITTLYAGLRAWKTIHETYVALTVVAAHFGVTANLAWLKALGPLALVAAKLVLVGLALEDVYVYMSGGDSVIGRFLDRFSAADTTLGRFARLLEKI